SEGGRYKTGGLAVLRGEIDGGRWGGGGDGGFRGVAVEGVVHVGVAQDDLDVLAGFGEGDGFDKFGDFVVGAFGFPERDPIFAGVISGGGVFGAAGGAGKVGDVQHAEFDVDVGIEERILGVANLAFLRQQAPGLRKNLHESDGVGVGNGVGLEGGLLADQ